MAYVCPHCQQPTISPLAKWLSGNVRFARCPGCGGFSSISAITARQCSAAGLVVAGLAVMAFALGQLHLGWLVAGLVAAVGVYVLAWHLVGLKPHDTGGWKLGSDWLPTWFAVVIFVVWWLGRHA